MGFWMRAARIWLPSALVLSAASGFAYVAVQQAHRTMADDPQMQLAEDAAARLDSGASAAEVVGSGAVDVATSLAPFVIVYDADSKPLASTGLLDGAAPVPPVGVLDSARRDGSNRVTWQPRSGVRIASIEVAGADGRVVLAGRSLREVERWVDELTTLGTLAWAAGLAGLLVVSVLVARLEGRKHGAASTAPTAHAPRT